MEELDSIFLMGAGFTKAVYPEAPLNAELLRAMTTEGHAPKLAHYHGKYKIDDIEKLLTLIDLDAVDNSKIKTDRIEINREISSFFSKFRFTEQNKKSHPWLEKFIFQILKPNDAIITLNYDCLLEGFLDYYEVWTPNRGYAGVQNMLADSFPKNQGVLIYKIHGSEHFVESAVANNPDQTEISFIIDSSIFPKSGAHRQFGGGIIGPRPSLIAPSFVKIPHVQIAAMMLDALGKARAARNLVIIGCGLRPEDSFLWLLLCHFLKSKSSHRRRLLFVSPSSETVWQRVSKYWIGNIQRIADVSVIPLGIESGVEKLLAEISGSG